MESVVYGVETAGILQATSATPICENFRRNGFCQMGNNCPYRHLSVTEEMRSGGTVIPCTCYWML